MAQSNAVDKYRGGARIVLCVIAGVATLAASIRAEAIRFATFNVALHRRGPEGLTQELATGDSLVARRLAAIIQRVRPDVLLLNEIDLPQNPTARSSNLDLFVDRYLAVGQFGQAGQNWPHRFTAGVNTGEPSGLDLDGDQQAGSGPADAWGYGEFPGQYAMAILSRWPIDRQQVRTFQFFRWSDLLKPVMPRRPEGAAFYPAAVWKQLRLSSKSHWDVPLQTPRKTIHFLVCHPTPPVFDGPEDRNGCRNSDEIQFWLEYIESAQGQHIADDRGQRGCLPEGVPFVMAGDLNADPVDGDGRRAAIRALLAHHRIQDPRPTSPGAARAMQVQALVNLRHQADPATDTADFDDRSVGNLRVDYVLPSRDLKVIGAGVFWPLENELGRDWIGASDHRLVWVDVE